VQIRANSLEYARIRRTCEEFDASMRFDSALV
jgi:hypothetical protein